jgi:hypothetical protein
VIKLCGGQSNNKCSPAQTGPARQEGVGIIGFKLRGRAVFRNVLGLGFNYSCEPWLIVAGEDKKVATGRLRTCVGLALQLVAREKKCGVMTANYAALGEKVRCIIKDDVGIGSTKAKRVDTGTTKTRNWPRRKVGRNLVTLKYILNLRRNG